MFTKTAKSCKKCGKTFASLPNASLSAWLFRLPECQCEALQAEDASEISHMKPTNSQSMAMDSSSNATRFSIFENGTLLQNRYEILSHLGSGGMGDVYLVLDRQTEQNFAMKLIRADNADDDYMKQRLEHEAKAAGSLHHRNIVRMYEFGYMEDGTAYLLMEYVRGETLERLLKLRTKLDSDSACNIFIQIAEALAHAHEKGVTHRDLKPSNVLLTRQGNGNFLVKLADFGIAKINEVPGGDRVKLTQTGEIIGSPFFMSPEQCQGETLDNRSDIYSLGCIIFLSLSGQLPFDGPNPVKILLKHISEAPPSLPPELGLNHGWTLLTRRCLAKSPGARYQTAQSLLQDLHRLQHQKSLLATLIYLNKSKLQKSVLLGVATGSGILLAVYGTNFTQRSLVPSAKENSPGSSASARVTLAPNSAGSVDSALPNAVGKLGAAEEIFSSRSSQGQKKYANVVNLTKHKKFAEALKEIDAIIADPTIEANTADLLAQKAEILLLRKDYRAAIKCFSAALKTKPSANILVDRGCAYFDLGELKNAKDDFEQALKLDPGSQSALRLRDDVATRMNGMTLSATVAPASRSAVEPDHDSSGGTKGGEKRGVQASTKVPADQALTAPPQAPMFKGSDSQTQQARSSSYRPTQGNSPDNKLGLSQPPSLAPPHYEYEEGSIVKTQHVVDDSENSYLRSDFLCLNQKTSEEIHAVLANSPKLVRERYARANSLYSQRNFRVAATTLSNLAKEPSLKAYSAWFYLVLARDYNLAGEQEKCLAALTEALALSSSPATNKLVSATSILTTRGHIYSTTGDQQKALDDLNAALDKNPNYSQALKFRDEIVRASKRS